MAVRSSTIAVIAVVIGVGVLLMSRKARAAGTPVSLEELQASGTAEELDLDNTIPPNLIPRARGLAVIVGELRDNGFRVTSMYRSPLVEAAVTFKNANPDTSPDVDTLVPEGGPHTECRACDVGGDGGSTRDPAVLSATKARLQRMPLTSRAAVQFFQEGDHVHLTFSGPILEELGKQVTS